MGEMSFDERMNYLEKGSGVSEILEWLIKDNAFSRR